MVPGYCLDAVAAADHDADGDDSGVGVIVTMVPMTTMFRLQPPPHHHHPAFTIIIVIVIVIVIVSLSLSLSVFFLSCSSAPLLTLPKNAHDAQFVPSRCDPSVPMWDCKRPANVLDPIGELRTLDAGRR